MPLLIRPASVADLATIVAYNQKMARETERRELNADVLRSGVSAVLGDHTKGRYFVAEEAGEVVGQTMITYEWSDWRNGTFWWIQSVYVREDKRGVGVFSALYRHIEQLARKQGGVCGLRLYAEEDNARAERTYLKLGMTRTNYRLFEVELITPGTASL
jgi:GNAT superfamily N-acetyltransferase